MFQGLEPAQIRGAVAAMLFVTDEPLSTITMADMLQVEPSEVELACVDLRAQYEAEESGIQLREVAGGWRLCTHPAFHELLEHYVLSWDTRKLSQAALEVLSIIAYTQPVTRAGVANIRGVNSDSSINSLIEKGLVREAGVEQAPGNPTLYATTRSFLEKFGLSSLKDLPDLDQYAPDEETREFIRMRLSAARGFATLDLTEDDLDSAQNFDAEELSEQMGDAMQAMMSEALSAAAGTVEKIDFDELEFEE
ncbi:MAG: SMC-Scp complex subunit ScpB [Eggerthellaceae bacterium]|nr:SMC-Scp complex subunit ScpB [Eggerthellaceae bacterium]